MPKAGLPLAAIAALLVALPARAQSESPSPWHLQIEALTEVPMDIGGRVVVEGPLRLRFSTSVGVMPGPYVDVINDFVVALGGYNQQTAALIESSLSSSVVWRTHLGWRPFPRAGLVFDVGYGLVALGGGVNAAEAIAAADSKTATSAPTAANYNVSSTLQMIDADLGWEWKLFGDRMVIEAGLGFSATLAASTSATPETTTAHGTKVRDAFGDAAAKYLDGLYTSYVYVPVATVAAGYRFF
jgi:hypothetical protein